MQDYNFTNITEGEDMNGPSFDWEACFNVVVMVVACVGIPLILLAIYGLYKEVREGQVAAPLYLINLLVSDLLQMSSSAARLKLDRFISESILLLIYFGGVFASVCFMVCISVERYLLVAFPLWFRFRRNIRNSVIVCVLVWLLTIITAILPFIMHGSLILNMVFLLLPFPVFIFSLVGTLKALLASVSVSRKEKQKIVTVLVLVLLNYTLLFLPFITFLLNVLESGYDKDYYLTFHYLISRIFLQLSPLVDLLLYVFMRRGMLTKLQRALRCCTKTPHNQAPQEDEEGEGGGASQRAEPH